MIYSVQDLVKNVENPNINFFDRVDFATQLSKIGDPRVKTFEPIMIDVASCTYEMGSSIDEVEYALNEYLHLFTNHDINEVREWFSKQCPKHDVEVKDFRVSKYLITNGNYLDFQKDTNQTLNNLVQDNSTLNHPVSNLTVQEAKRYCNWLSKKLNRNFRLPTEKEWEWLAMSCKYSFRYPWGNKFDKNFANIAELGLNKTTAVGLFPQGFSEQGIADLAGNVEEWTDTIYAPYPNGKLITDRLYNFGNGEYNILRGGCFSLHGDLCLSKRRHGFYPAYSVTGFRIVESIN